MHLGSFLAVFASLLIVLSLTFPIGSGFAKRSPDVYPAPESPARCYELTYRPADYDKFLPREVRLEPRIRFRGGNVYQADPVDDPRVGAGWWAPVGADSVDVMAWHHAHRVRIPSEGGWGYGTAPYFGNLFQAITEQALPVHAVRVPCSRSSTPDAA